MTALIEAGNLVKVFPDGTRAVDDITFAVEPGEIFGFLGPNGAGKTTAIRILVTLLRRTSGMAAVGGYDVAQDAGTVRSMIGYAGQFIGVDPDLTGFENLVFQGRLHSMGKQAAATRADDLLALLALPGGKRAGAYSGGMRRRLDLAQALVHEPPIVFLDEPTTGLDPQTRNALWEHLRELNANGTTIFLTTQYLEEADRLCNRIAIIDRGRIEIDGTPAELKAGVGGDVVEVTLPPEVADEERDRAVAALADFPGAGTPTVYDRSIAVPVPDASRAISELVRHLDDAGVSIARLGFSTPTLDEVFLRHTGTRLRVEEGTSHTDSSFAKGMVG